MNDRLEAGTRFLFERLREIDAVSLSLPRGFTWSSGIVAPVYVDHRRLISDPIGRKLVVENLLFQIEATGIDPGIVTLAGVATAGVPWSAWVADRLSCPMVYVRSAPKSHGHRRLVEGAIVRGAKVVLVEDVFTTGGSSQRAIDALAQSGLQVMHTVGIMTYGLPSLTPRLQAAGSRVSWMYMFSDLSKFIFERGGWSRADFEEISEWLASLTKSQEVEPTVGAERATRALP